MVNQQETVASPRREDAPTNAASLVRQRQGEQHKMINVNFNGRKVRIDEGIAPLIAELWKAGIKTTMSCEENRPGVMWILFPHTWFAELFLTAVAPSNVLKWDYKLHPEIFLKERVYHFSCSIRFPKGDYPVLLKRMREFNGRDKNTLPEIFRISE